MLSEQTHTPRLRTKDRINIRHVDSRNFSLFLFDVPIRVLEDAVGKLLHVCVQHRMRCPKSGAYELNEELREETMPKRKKDTTRSVNAGREAEIETHTAHEAIASTVPPVDAHCSIPG